MQDERKVFDQIPEQFDRMRWRYSPDMFATIIDYAHIDERSRVLEIGPGTGQATEPLLKTGCRYLAIELGEHLADFCAKKFANYPNFTVVNADFETYDFGGEKFDLVFSAATIQWIPEKIAFGRSFDLLKSGGVLAMAGSGGDYRTPNPVLHDEIQKMYDEHFVTETPYMHRGFRHENAKNYGFADYHTLEFKSVREFTADKYVDFIGTHADHIGLVEPHRSAFFGGIHDAIVRHGDKLVMNMIDYLRLTRKP